MAGVSVAYVLTFLITFEVGFPLQDYFFPSLENHVSLLFLPHGVRIIAAWLFGARSILFLFPGEVATHFLLWGNTGLEMEILSTILIGCSVGWLGFWLVGLFGLVPRGAYATTSDWKVLMIAGVAASLLNSLLNSLAFGSGLANAVGYLIGDISGQFFLMLLMIYAMRWIVARTA